MTDPAPLKQLSDFAPHVSRAFHLTGPDGIRKEATLVEARAVKSDRLKGTARAPFCLLFRLDAGAPPGQGMYRVEDPDGGEHAVFLSRVWMEEDGQFLEAVFN